MEETKKTVILTGFAKNEAKKLSDKDLQPCCYLCRRKVGSEGVYLAKDENEDWEGFQELKFGVFGVVSGGDIEFEFFMCHECQIILSAIASKKLVAK